VQESDPHGEALVHEVSIRQEDPRHGAEGESSECKSEHEFVIPIMKRPRVDLKTRVFFDQMNEDQLRSRIGAFYFACDAGGLGGASPGA
jgi:hypothetical protein